MIWRARLRDAKYEFNKISGNTASWTVNQSDVDAYREMKRQYKEAMKPWKLFFECGPVEESNTLSDVYIQRFYPDRPFERFGTAPVRNAYWAPVIGKEAYGEVALPEFCPKLLSHPIPKEIARYFEKKLLPEKNANTVTFRRFPRLELPEYASYPEDILTKALLGLLEPLGCKFAQGHAILNDSWTINLREIPKENLMLDMFLKGFDGKAEELKKAWEGRMPVDVSEELKDLLKVYKDASEHLVKQEGYKLDQLVSSMKDFIKVHEERKMMERKLKNLIQKVEPPKHCEGCDHDDEDEEDE